MFANSVLLDTVKNGLHLGNDCAKTLLVILRIAKQDSVDGRIPVSQSLLWSEIGVIAQHLIVDLEAILAELPKGK